MILLRSLVTSQEILLIYMYTGQFLLFSIHYLSSFVHASFMHVFSPYLTVLFLLFALPFLQRSYSIMLLSPSVYLISSINPFVGPSFHHFILPHAHLFICSSFHPFIPSSVHPSTVFFSCSYFHICSYSYLLLVPYVNTLFHYLSFYMFTLF